MNALSRKRIERGRRGKGGREEKGLFLLPAVTDGAHRSIHPTSNRHLYLNFRWIRSYRRGDDLSCCLPPRDGSDQRKFAWKSRRLTQRATRFFKILIVLREEEGRKKEEGDENARRSCTISHPLSELSFHIIKVRDSTRIRCITLGSRSNPTGRRETRQPSTKKKKKEENSNHIVWTSQGSIDAGSLRPIDTCRWNRADRADIGIIREVSELLDNFLSCAFVRCADLQKALCFAQSAYARKIIRYRALCRAQRGQTDYSARRCVIKITPAQNTRAHNLNCFESAVISIKRV